MSYNETMAITPTSTEEGIAMTTNQISIESVDRVYFGKAGKCCCGCAGTYSDNDGSRKATVAKAVNRVNGALAGKLPAQIDDERRDMNGTPYVAVTTGDRICIVYLRKQERDGVAQARAAKVADALARDIGELRMHIGEAERHEAKALAGELDSYSANELMEYALEMEGLLETSLATLRKAIARARTPKTSTKAVA